MAYLFIAWTAQSDKNIADGLQQESQLPYIVRDLCSLFLKLFVSTRDTKWRGMVKMANGKAGIQRGPDQAGEMS